MGLPIWRAPSPADHRAQAVKNDASAATRSPIRRSSPASSRPGRIPARSDANGPSRRYISVAELITRRANGREAERRTQERRTADLSSMADDWLSDLDRLASIASESREQASSPEDRVHLYISTDGPSIRASRHGPSHPENDPLSRSRSDAHERESSSDPDRPLPRELWERPRSAPRGTDVISRLSGRRRRVWPPRAQEPLGELPRHTYRRAPSNWPFASESVDGNEESAPTDAGRDMADATRDLPPLRRMGRRQVTNGLLPASYLRQSWSPPGTLDGLGDRERSLSPPADPWETMLTTITPDAQLPSRDSSFTSAAASASFSASNNSQDGSESARGASVDSPNTQLTVPSRRPSQDESSALPQRGCETDDDMSGNDTEGEERLGPRGSASRSRRDRSWGFYDRPRSRQDGPPTRNPAAYPPSVRSRSHDATTLVQNYFTFAERASSSGSTSPPAPSRSPPPRSSQFTSYILPRLPGLYRENSSGGVVERSFENRRDSGVGSDAANTSTSGGGSGGSGGSSSDNRMSSSTPALPDFADILDRVAERHPQMDPELESMRDILGRLARRDDVPEEFWTGAGLVPPMLEGAPRRDQREGAWDEA
ncbi:uncharacterized protein BKCO1_6900031 [Diplodia corticola]|uniref:Uncharacterized protein n=1 Tax=Diplodia corticola TaxID=236234 RepID=A0A1J9QNC7_9PEZI|nr:uncharacterized protein BKCO1_6900031 [Diplodia corticola]OJD29961.1 hypothetical protein BKCO1_6900031 [Diplodia corticola]